MNVKIRLLKDGLMPEQKRDGDACFDCHAAIEQTLTIFPHERKLIGLGFCLEIPDGYEAVIRPRSGLTSKGIDSAIGTIDSNYRGELKACLINNSPAEFIVEPDDRICQLAIRRTEPVAFSLCDSLSETNRGDNGFGSTGL